VVAEMCLLLLTFLVGSAAAIGVLASSSIVSTNSKSGARTKNAYWALSFRDDLDDHHFMTLIYENGTSDKVNTFQHIANDSMADCTGVYRSQGLFISAAELKSQFFVTNTLTKGKQQYIVEGQ
jgi:hypothetical protein